MSNKNRYQTIFEKIKQENLSVHSGVQLIKEYISKQKNNPLSYFTMVLNEIDALPDIPGGHELITCLVFSFDNNVLLRSEENLSRMNNNQINPVFIRNGVEYSRDDESGYTIDYKNYKHLKELFADFKTNNRNIHKVLFLCSYNEDWEFIIEHDIKTIFLLTKILLQIKQQIPTEIYCCFPGNDTVYPAIYRALGGFARTLHLESKKVCMRLIEFADSTDIQDWSILLTEMRNSRQNNLYIQYKHTKRYVLSLKEIDLQVNANEHCLIKENGVYIITGGMGGLGVLFAEFLAGTYKARLILTGRSPLDDNKRITLKDIINKGGEVEYIQGNIAQNSDVKKIISITKEKWGSINGIIHTAGVVRDSLISKLDMDHVKDVLLPKINGTIFLDKATKNEPIDFFVYFSSSSVLGNIGQADYAYANSFMDNFSSHRNHLVELGKRQGKTVSINWPYWESGGMRIDKQKLELIFKTTGTQPLSSDKGISSFLSILNNQYNQVFVLSGNKNKIIQKLDLLPENTDAEIETGADVPADNKEIVREAIHTFIISEVAGILKINESEIDSNVDLDEYGFDSGSFTIFINRINSKYNIDITPAVLFEYATIASFEDYLIDDFSEKLRKVTGLSSAQQDPKFKQTVVTESNPASAMNFTISTQNNNDINIVEKVKEFLLEEVSELLKIPVTEINPDLDLDEYGFDFGNFTVFSNRINKKYDLEITPAVFFEFTTINTFTQFLVNEYKEQLYEFYNLPNNKNNQSYRKEEVFVSEQFIGHQIDNFRFLDSPDNIVNTELNNHSFHQPVAIIGMAGIMPGADNLDEFWKNLESGKDCITEIPPDRWDWKKYWGDPSTEDNKTSVKWGGFIRNIDKFDAAFFGITPREAALMDPQQRLLLEVVWKTIEDSGYKASSLSGTNTAVFIGVGGSDYSELMLEHNVVIDAYTPTGNTHSIFANRISYLLNITGPSEIVDTACSSSLVALHRAVKALQYGECSMAIVGATQLFLSPSSFIALDKLNMLSRTGKCKSFDENADGFVKGEGVGAVFLKPLHKAIEDNDHIYALIKGTSINHNGKSKSLTAPNPNGISKVIIDAIKNAKVDPASISYIEAHGTGTNLGDTIEINGLKKAFKIYLPKVPEEKFCGIGSVKTNIGHLEVSSGMAGLFKVILSMKNGILPGNIHLSKVNPYIKLSDSPFYIVDKSQKWEHLKDNAQNEIPYRAGLSSFGFGGVNGCIVLEEFCKQSYDRGVDDNEYLFILSARTKDALDEYAELFRKWLKTSGVEYPLADITYTLHTGREVYEKRVALIVSDKDDVIKKLDKFIKGEIDNQKIFYTENAMEIKEYFGFLLKDKTGKDFILQSIRNKELYKIARLWSSGYDIDFSILYKNKVYNKIPVPGYPFEREMYWFDDPDKKIHKKDNMVFSKVSDTLKTKIRKADYVQEIIELIAEISRIPAKRLTVKTLLNKQGIDSILTMQIASKIEKKFNVKINLSEMAMFNTIDDWNKFIVNSKEQNVDKSSFSKIKTDTPDDLNKMELDPEKEEYDKQCINRYKLMFKDYYANLNIFLNDSSCGLKIETIICGPEDGEPLLFLGGLGTTVATVAPTIIELARYYKVIAFHYPGCGRSEFSKEKATSENIAKSFVKDLGKLGIKTPYHLIGWSMGGLFAEYIAINYPEKINKLILISTAASAQSNGTELTVDEINTFYIKIRNHFESSYPKDSEMSFKDFDHVLRCTFDKEAELYYFEDTISFNHEKLIKNIKAPTLIISGEKDIITMPEAGKFMESQINKKYNSEKNDFKTEYIEIKDGSHLMLAFKYREINPEIINFLLYNYSSKYNRKLGVNETFFKEFYDQSYYTNIISFVAGIEGNINVEFLKQALTCLIMRHPILRATIKEFPGYYKFRVSDLEKLNYDKTMFNAHVQFIKDYLPFIIVERKNDRYWEEMLKEESSKDIAKFSKYLWRCILIKSPTDNNKHEILFLFNHCIVEAMSIAHFTRELLEAYGSIAELNTEEINSTHFIPTQEPEKTHDVKKIKYADKSKNIKNSKGIKKVKETKDSKIISDLFLRKKSKDLNLVSGFTHIASLFVFLYSSFLLFSTVFLEFEHFIHNLGIPIVSIISVSTIILIALMGSKKTKVLKTSKILMVSIIIMTLVIIIDTIDVHDFIDGISIKEPIKVIDSVVLLCFFILINFTIYSIYAAIKKFKILHNLIELQRITGLKGLIGVLLLISISISIVSFILIILTVFGSFKFLSILTVLSGFSGLTGMTGIIILTGLIIRKAEKSSKFDLPLSKSVESLIENDFFFFFPMLVKKMMSSIKRKCEKFSGKNTDKNNLFRYFLLFYLLVPFILFYSGITSLLLLIFRPVYKIIVHKREKRKQSKSMESEILSPKFENRELGNHYYTGYIFKEMNENDTKDLIQYCKNNEVSVNSVLSAVLLLSAMGAFFSTIRKENKVILGIPINVRNYCRLNIYNLDGMNDEPLSLISNKIEVAHNPLESRFIDKRVLDLEKSLKNLATEEIGRIIKKFHSEVKLFYITNRGYNVKDLLISKYKEKLYIKKKIDKNVIRSQVSTLINIIHTNKQFTNIGDISNLGILKFDKEYGSGEYKLELKKSFFSMSNVSGGIPYFLSIITLHNKLYYGFSYPEHLISKDTINQINTEFMRIINLACSPSKI